MSKINVSQLDPNPFRKIDHYPINRAKVTALRNSINETGFWDNIVVRKHPSKKDRYQIAYGHHRLQAVKESGIVEVDVPVRDLDDIAMIRIMANENMDEWKSNVAVTNETVLTAKEFIEGEVRKAGRNYRQLPEEIAKLWESEGSFANHALRGSGVENNIWIGEKVITRFLGSNWDTNVVKAALAILNDPEIDRKAVEEFKSPAHADTFRRAVKAVNERTGTPLIPKEKQHAFAREIKKEISEEAKTPHAHRNDFTAQQIERKVYEKMAETTKRSPEKKESLAALLAADEYSEWAAWVAICDKINNRKSIPPFSRRAQEEIKKVADRCSELIADKMTEVN